MNNRKTRQTFKITEDDIWNIQIAITYANIYIQYIPMLFEWGKFYIAFSCYLTNNIVGL